MTTTIRDYFLPEDTARFAIFASVFFLFWFAVLYLLFRSSGISEPEEQYIYLLFFGSAPVCAAAAIWCTAFPRKWPLGGSTTLLLGFALPAVVLVAGFRGIDIALYHAEYETPNPSAARFGLGMALALAAIAVALTVRRRWAGRSEPFNRRDRLLRWLGYVVATAALLSLFDVNITLDTLSYAPYVGPAAAMLLDGAVPMLDVFSQYGLNFVLFAAALKVLPWSMFSTTLLVALLNIAYYLVVCLIARNLTTSKLFSFVAMVFIVMFLHAASLYNITYTPSVLAMRFLPPLLVVLALTRLPQGRWINGGTAAAMAVCALWSVEALAFGVAVYGAFILILGAARRADGWRKPALAVATLLGCIALPHMLLSLGYYAWTGAPPRYNVYWEIVSSHQGQEGHWLLPIDPRISTWMLFGFSYALGFGWALFAAWRAAGTARDPARLACIGALCAFGMVQFSYYIGRSATPVLVFLAFPMAVLLVLALDRLWSTARVASEHPRLRIYVTALASVVLVGMGGVLADRMFRPIGLTGSNSTVLRSCLAPRDSRLCSPRRVVRSIWSRIEPAPAFPTSEAAGWSTREENRAAYEFVMKYQRDEPKLLLFVTDSAAVLFLTRKTNRLGFVHPMVDGRSATLVKHAMQALDSVREGSIAIVGDTGSVPSDEEILVELRRRWQFCELESRNIVTAYRLERKGAGACR